MDLLRLFRHASGTLAAISAIALMPQAVPAANMFVQTNLTSDIPGMAANTDMKLKNPWGMAFGPTSPFWVSDQATNFSTLYSATGAPQSLVVSIPTTAAGPQGPTGLSFNGTPSFEITPTHPALFLFSTLSGTIDGWNAALTPNTSAVTLFTAPAGTVYTGLTNAAMGTGNFLYAADFGHNKIDVVDTAFHQVPLATLVSPSNPNPFVDTNLPAGYAAYNVENINGKLYVQYAKVDPITHRASEDLNQGVVDVFDTSGKLLQRLATDTHLSSPWGITLAPAGFGMFGNDLLVGNFGDGTIDAFDPVSGAFLGQLLDSSGKPIVNDGLWSLKFRNAPGFDPNTLFFTAGINDEANGLFGSLQPVPEPSTVLLLGLGCLALMGWRRSANRSSHTVIGGPQ